MLSNSSKRLSSSAAAAASSTIGNNCNLLADILYFLPVKSLFVFKTVSKQWQSLISDPQFKRNYNLRRRPHSKPALFMKKRSIVIPLGTKESEYQTLVMDERNDHVPSHIPITVKGGYGSRISFKQSCNGLVLFELHEFSKTTYVVYNPSMKQWKTLPSLPFREPRLPYVPGVTIAFDPVKSSYHDVVAVCNADTSKDIYHIEIYSSKTNTWRNAGDPFSLSPPGIVCHSGVYWNGSVHWIDQWTATLYYFDIGCELMKKTALPTKPYPQGEYIWKTISYFRECMGHIHLMEMRRGNKLHFDIWEMLVDYSGWHAKFYVDLTLLTTIYPSIVPNEFYFRPFKLYVLLVDERKDSSKLILWIAEDKVISFDLKDKSVKEMYDVKPDVWVEGFEYIETLANP